MTVRTIERRPLRADVTRDLTARIVAGELPAGTRLRDTALAAEMGVSRTPVREALVTLSHSGWLEADAGKGFTVAPLRIDDVMNGYPIVWTLERLALTLCPPFTSPALDVLTELNAEFLGADMSPLDRIALDDSWHRALLESCRNTQLLAIIDATKTPLRRYEVAYARLRQPSTSRAEHAAIIAALREGDSARACDALVQNWRGTMVELETAVRTSSRRST